MTVRENLERMGYRCSAGVFDDVLRAVLAELQLRRNIMAEVEPRLPVDLSHVRYTVQRDAAGRTISGSLQVDPASLEVP